MSTHTHVVSRPWVSNAKEMLSWVHPTVSKPWEHGYHSWWAMNGTRLWTKGCHVVYTQLSTTIARAIYGAYIFTATTSCGQGHSTFRNWHQDLQMHPHSFSHLCSPNVHDRCRSTACCLEVGSSIIRLYGYNDQYVLALAYTSIMQSRDLSIIQLRFASGSGIPRRQIEWYVGSAGVGSNFKRRPASKATSATAHSRWVGSGFVRCT